MKKSKSIDKEGHIRNSSFELLRILSILLIISFHYFIHGNNEQIFTSDFTSNKILAYTFGIWGRLGVNCFIFISSWFLVKSNFELAASSPMNPA